MIPEFDLQTGHLPCGRYRTTFTEVHERLVLDPRFAASTTRADLFAGMIGYMAAWDEAVKNEPAPPAEQPPIRGLWIAGSFASVKLDPENVDLTLIIDEAIIDNWSQSKTLLRKLTGRQSMKAKYGVEPFVISYAYVQSWISLGSLSGSQADYLQRRALHDDWNQRVRPQGEDNATPSLETSGWARGYLEVTP